MTIIKILPAKYSETNWAKRMRKYRAAHPDYVNKDTERRKNRRLLIMDALGGRKCKNCGYDDVRALVLDHLNGGGHQLRLQGSLKMYTFYYNNLDVAKHDLQVLCCNCNAIKQRENKEYAFGGGVRGNGRECKQTINQPLAQQNSIYNRQGQRTKKGKRI